MSFSQILDARRAINFFDPEQDVSDETLHKLLEAAALSPSSFNLQPWKVVVVRSQAQKEALRELAFNQPKITEAPVILMLLGDRDGWKEGNSTLESVFSSSMQPEQRDWFIGATSGLYGASKEMQQAFANKNAGLFAMTLMYSAIELGLHTHPMDGFNLEAVRNTFDIPDNYWIPMLIAVGHKATDAEIKPKAWRQPAKDIILKTL